MSDKSLYERVKIGVAWNAASMITSQVVSLIRAVIIARLLIPDDFGLFSMAATIMGAINALTSIGLEGSIIADTCEDERELSKQLNTIWTAELIRRAFLTLILLSVIYPTTLFYGDRRLWPILIVTSFVPLLQGFQNIGLVLLRKRINFKRIAWYEQSSNIITTVVAVCLAFITRNVWALVLGQIFSVCVSVFLSYEFHSYRPHFEFDSAAFRKAFKFGKYVFVISVMTYITTTGDNIIVGKMMGSSALGVYAVAYSLANLPVVVIGGVLSAVMFPVYAELGGQSYGRLDAAFTRAFTLTSTLLVVVVAPIFLLADEIILMLYGEKWAVAGPLLRVLVLVGLFRGLAHILSPLIIGMNLPKLDARAKVLEAVVLLSLLYPMVISYGLSGAAWAGVIAYLIAFLTRVWFVKEILPQAFGRILTTLIAVFFSGLLAVTTAAMILTFLDEVAAKLVVGTAIVTTLTLLTMLSLRHDLRKELRVVIASLQVQAAKTRVESL